MFYNGAECDIYIGEGAGGKLMEDLKGATQSIKIVSPYLSPSLMEVLIKSKSKGVDVRLITVDGIEEREKSVNEIKRKLIKQHREVDDEAVKKRDKLIMISRILLGSIIALCTCLMLIYACHQERAVLYGIFPLFILFYIYKLLQRKIKEKRIYNYSYSQLFPFKVCVSSPNSYIHAKIYLINDKIAYLGSLNFTTCGTKSNYESRIRTENSKAIKAIKDEFDRLFEDENIPEKEIQSWGKYLYSEQIN